MRFTRTRTMAFRATAALFVAAVIAVPATANAKSISAGITRGGNLVVIPSPVQSWVDAFNPAFSGGNVYGQRGLIYESLIQFNGETGKATPWLATKWGWANKDKTLWFKIRSGVKWNDGQSFSAADVVYSANLTLNNAAFDGDSGMDPFVSSVSASGSTVYFHLKTINTTLLYYIGQNLLILPKHIWSSVANPTTFTDPNPVGTGPFMLQSFSPQEYVLKANPYYWQAGKPYLSTLTFPSYASNQSAEQDLISGQAQWGGLFIADAAKTLVKDGAAGNGYWYDPANQPAALYLNDAKQPFSNVWVRRAISEVIDREKVYQQGEYGYETPSNAGFVQTQYKKTWGDPTVLKMLKPNGNLKAAKADIKQAMKSKATASALKNSFNVEVVAGWSDWDASVAIISSELKSIGINAVEDQTDFTTYNNDLNNGTYDMAMSWTYGGLPNPYPIFKFAFGSAFYVPDGHNSNGNNRSRYKNPALDRLINGFAKTTAQATQVADIKKMEDIVASAVPAVPLVTQAYWYEYNGSQFTGFPTAKNPYEIGSPYQNYEIETVALHLHLK